MHALHLGALPSITYLLTHENISICNVLGSAAFKRNGRRPNAQCLTRALQDCTHATIRLAAQRK
jgi:hypothetical protein